MEEAQQDDTNKEEYIGSYFNFQKYLINPELKQKNVELDYLTKDLGIAFLDKNEIMILNLILETADYCDVLGCKRSKLLFHADAHRYSVLSRSKAGFGARLLVTQISSGNKRIELTKPEGRFLGFGKKQQDSGIQDYQQIERI